MPVKVDYDALVLTDRMKARVTKPDGEDGCWIYPTRHEIGYSTINAQGTNVVAHRLFYTALVGPVPRELTLDHLCRNRACVNPAHLEPVTQAENVRRGEAGLYNRVKTHCRNGHPYAGDNVRTGPYGRACRTCNNEACARYRDRRRARVAA